MTTVGVWIPFRPAGSLGRPEELPLGRAALALVGEGIDVVFGSPQPDGRFAGARARPGVWEAVADVVVNAVYDRFRSVTEPDAFRRGLAQLGPVPFGNPPAFTSLCRDKLLSQRALEASGLRLPKVALATRSSELRQSGSVFVKPRFGSFGRGVRFLGPDDPIGDVHAGLVVQRAVPPPIGWAGISVRVLVQRTVHGHWVARSPVARRERDDPVVNAARGADVLPAADLDGVDVSAVRALAAACAASLAEASGHHVSAEPAEHDRGLPQVSRPAPVEVGVDLVLDDALRPWPIEANGRPRGRLAALAAAWPDRFDSEHLEACATPLRTLASLV